jgi:hyperosmotically inducible protein
MKRQSLLASTIAICVGVVVGPGWQAIGQTDMPSTNAPDNTARNTRDKNGDSLAPIKQSATRSDIDLVARIRRKLNKDDALSMTAKNVKIITIDRHVTLHGPVKTEREKSDIEARAAAIAGPANVDDQPEVAAQ